MDNMKPLKPFKLWAMQNFPFIADDFDQMTYYELLCKIVEYLNNVIGSQNQVIGNMNYILNYFNNLLNDLNAMGIIPPKCVEVFFVVWKKLKNFKKVFIPGKMASEYYC